MKTSLTGFAATPPSLLLLLHLLLDLQRAARGSFCLRLSQPQRKRLAVAVTLTAPQQSQKEALVGSFCLDGKVTEMIQPQRELEEELHIFLSFFSSSSILDHQGRPLWAAAPPQPVSLRPASAGAQRTDQRTGQQTGQQHRSGFSERLRQ